MGWLVLSTAVEFIPILWRFGFGLRGFLIFAAALDLLRVKGSGKRAGFI